MKYKARLFPPVILTIVLTFVMIGVVLAASVTVDTFNLGSQDLTANSGTATNSGTADDASILGTERDIVVTYVSGGGNVVARVDNSNSNLFTFSQDSGVSGNAVLYWDGNDNDPVTLAHTGLGGVDLVSSPANDGFIISIVSNDLTMNLILRVYTSSTAFSERTISLPGNITTGERVDMFFPLSTFTNFGGGATYTNVGAVELQVNPASSPDRDVAIDLLETSLSREYGDLPAAYNLTTLSDNGARHIPQGLRLGVNLDGEADGAESSTTTGDDTASSPDDEDGVVRSGPLWNPTDGGSVDVTVNGCPIGTCRLNGWIDWNHDNDFADTNEHILTNFPVGNGTNPDLTFTIPSGTTVPGNIFNARFRVCQTNTGLTGCNSLTGETTNGEVEDYQWSFSPSAVTMGPASTANTTSNNSIVITVGIVLLVGATSLIVRRKS